MIKDFLKGKSICIIGAHPDDIELGLGGTLNQISPDVRVDIFSGSNHIEDNETIDQELRDSMNLYKIEQWVVHNFDTRKFYEKQDLIRNDIFALYRNYDVFFTHSKHSQHADHRLLGEAVDDIIKEKTVITFEEVHSGKNISINAWNEISSDDLTMKIHALDCYKSQAKRPYFEGDHITTLARYRGNQILKPYAEAFNVVRLVL